MTVAMRYLGKLPRNGNLQRQELHIFRKMQTSVPPQYPPCWLERFAVGSLYVNHLVRSLYNLPRLMLMNSLNPSPQNIMLNTQETLGGYGGHWWSFPAYCRGIFWIFPILLMLRDFHRLVTISNTLVGFHLKKSSMVISGT